MPSRYLFAAIVIGIFSTQAAAQPFTLQGPGLDPADFEVTTFASGLNFPVGMTELDDGSLLVAVNNGTTFFGSTTGSLIRLADTNGDGVADVQQTLVSNVPGGKLTSVKRAGDLIAVTGQGPPISIYRVGATPSAPLTLEGQLSLTYPSGWIHLHSSLLMREKPATPDTYELYFQVGSDDNFAASTGTISLGGDLGITASLVGDALHRVEITDSAGTLSAGGHSVVATGLRNATGLAFHPVSGDLYIGENGIDGLVDANEPTSPDEINVLPAGDLYGAAEDYGFPSTYEEYRTEAAIGSAGIQPLVNFQPLPTPDGEEAEGINEIAFSPPLFPAPLAGGVFAGFHGKFSNGGLANEENALGFVDLTDASYFHAVSNDEPGVGHPDGLLSTTDTLYISDLSPNGSLGAANQNTGKIYAVRAVVLSGDYNRDGVVDAADYAVWRNSLGQEGIGLPADGDGDYAVTAADYELWRQAYGAAASGAGQGVPEPAAAALVLIIATTTVLSPRDNDHI